jgi:hypothetical protein
MKHAVTTLAIAAAAAFAAPASAAVIDFNAQADGLFTNFVEDGYTVTAGDGVGVFDSGTLSVTNPGSFSFFVSGAVPIKLSSFDFLPTGGTAPYYQITGYTGTTPTQLAFNSTFASGTVPFSTAAYDKIGFTLLNLGSAVSIDNITVAAVPEPATWAMMVLGLAAIGMTLRQRRRQGDASGSVMPALA